LSGYGYGPGARNDGISRRSPHTVGLGHQRIGLLHPGRPNDPTQHASEILAEGGVLGNHRISGVDRCRVRISQRLFYESYDLLSSAAVTELGSRRHHDIITTAENFQHVLVALLDLELQLDCV
jgi:hypothetical protein